VTDSKSLHIIEDNRGTETGPCPGPLLAKGDMVEVNIFCMADIEAPGRQFAEHGEFGIVFFILRDLVQAVPLIAAEGGVVFAVVDDPDMFEGDVFHRMSREAGDRGRKDIMWIPEGGPFCLITPVGLVRRHIHGNVPDRDVADDAGGGTFGLRWPRRIKMALPVLRAVMPCVAAKN
jgi:hypothetical protein